MRTRVSAAAGPATAPELAFRVEGASVQEFAAAPTLRFLIGIEGEAGAAIRSVQLNAQIRIAATARAYDAATQERLADLFGEPQRWGTTLRSLLWTQATLSVPPFTGRTTVELPVACTYDFDVAATKYFHGVEDGEIPLEFLFSGTVFYTDGEGALRAARISWEKEAAYRLPVAIWKATMRRYFPNSAWLRLHQDTFDRLYAFRSRRALPSWEAALELLLQAAEQGGER